MSEERMGGRVAKADGRSSAEPRAKERALRQRLRRLMAKQPHFSRCATEPLVLIHLGFIAD
jgi:hypothetical protein